MRSRRPNWRCVVIGHRADVEFIFVANVDRKRLCRERGIGRGRSDGNVIRSRRFPIDRAVDRHDTGVGIDREPPTGIVVERIGNDVRAVRIGS